MILRLITLSEGCGCFVNAKIKFSLSVQVNRYTTIGRHSIHFSSKIVFGHLTSSYFRIREMIVSTRLPRTSLLFTSNRFLLFNVICV